MDVCPDYEDLFKSLNEHKIKYLVVGAQAVIFYTEPRYTKDMDIWIPHDLNDPKMVYKALKNFGAPLTDVTPKDFLNKKFILQIGVAPVRIDILISLKGAQGQRAWQNRRRTCYGKTPIFILGIVDLYRVKRSVGRPQDDIDAEKLLQWHSQKVGPHKRLPSS